MAKSPIPWDVASERLHGLPVVHVDGRWCVHLAEGEKVPIPGARSMKVEEFVRGRFRTTRRYGLWIEIGREIARSDHHLLQWCRRHCNDELPSGNFRFAPTVWERHRGDPLPIPFFPERDDPSPAIRELAKVEFFRRTAEHQLRLNRTQRDELIRIASEEGHSRRDLGRLLGLSSGRVQQLVQDQPPEQPSAAGA